MNAVQILCIHINYMFKVLTCSCIYSERPAGAALSLMKECWTTEQQITNKQTNMLKPTIVPVWFGPGQSGSLIESSSLIPFQVVSVPSLQRQKQGSHPAQSIFSCCWPTGCREPGERHRPTAATNAEHTLILYCRRNRGRSRTWGEDIQERWV